MMTAPNDDPFRALADPTRRQILELLRRRPRAVRELADRFPQMSRPAVSKHLRILKAARLADETRDGRRRIYRLASENRALALVKQWLGSMGTGPAGADLPAPRARPPVRVPGSRRRKTGRAASPPAGQPDRSRPKPTPKPKPKPKPKPVEPVERSTPAESGDAGGDWRSW